MAINKIVATAKEAVADIGDGSVVAIAGFGQSHRYPALLPALLERGVKDLTTVSNSLGGREFSLASLIENHRVKKMIISITSRADDQIASGEIEVEMVPQGTLSERLRAGGSGIPAFYTPTGVGTRVAEGKETKLFDGVQYLLERAIRPDFSFVRAWRGDRFGNLQYRGVGRNFNYAFAKGGGTTIAEVDEIVAGTIDPELVGVPGVFVDRIVETVASGPTRFAAQRGGIDEEPQMYNGKPGWTRAEIAEVAAGLLPEPSYVNLGLGMPTLISNFIGQRDIVLHSENGILGFGDYATEEEWDPDIYNAGGGFVQLRPGASFFDSVTSFEMVRSGGVNVVVLGGLQVDRAGNLANWATSERAGGTIGGAMDLAAGGATVVVMMTHRGGRGEPKLVERCSYPLTGVNCVDLVVTDLAVLRRHQMGFQIERVHPDFSVDEIVDLTEMEVTTR